MTPRPDPPPVHHPAPAAADPAVERIGSRRVAALRASIATRKLTPSLSICPRDGLGSAEGDLAWWSGLPTRAEDPPPLDWPLRRELAMRLLRYAPGRAVLGVWTRPGPPEPGDGDLQWAAALRHGAAAYGGPAPLLLVVTRWGWFTLPDGSRQIWRAPRRPGAAGA